MRYDHDTVDCRKVRRSYITLHVRSYLDQHHLDPLRCLLSSGHSSEALSTMLD